MPTARWSTVNAREAFAGVVTPLTYTFYFPGAERASARFWKDLGLLERGAPDVPDDSDLCFFGRFHGRMAINVDRYGEMADRTPGTSAAAMEEQMFGVARTGAGTGHTRRRYPIVALVAPRTIWRARRDTRRDARDDPGGGPAWRREWLHRLRTADPTTARTAFREARDRLEAVLYRHIMLTALAQGCFDAAARLALAAGRPGAEAELVASTGGTEEAHMIEALHRVAAGTRTMASFLDEYGYHGPDEGHLEATVWRTPETCSSSPPGRCSEKTGSRTARSSGGGRNTSGTWPPTCRTPGTASPSRSRFRRRPPNGPPLARWSGGWGSARAPRPDASASSTRSGTWTSTSTTCWCAARRTRVGRR
ncbi:MAG TPA: hypothetical protein VL595_14355 [Pseudonocardia sp.]|nr:hypothetical protein [Pseudonocardia sp.]